MHIYFNVADAETSRVRDAQLRPIFPLRLNLLKFKLTFLTVHAILRIRVIFLDSDPYVSAHCLKWLKFHFFELENSRLFAEFLVPIGWIIFSGL